ncbi:Ig-like domain-containing protein [Thalassoroseus pseudoceratinae]|uniref:hypothetical protein n=1 Tax=Thalassoroseus pseudoceratinae TaxID=2713176 RepID=UPI001421022A|nr:hypothetical protein [Thalassoroseus pseudoceratinae]
MHRLILLIPMVLGFMGCGNGLSTLEGTVTVDGNPAPEGINLSFTPADGTGSPSYASTDADGHYEAAFSFQKKGIKAGEHRVQLVPGNDSGSNTMPQIGPDGKPVPSSKPKRPQFPKEYYQEIQLITVESGHNTIDLDLKSTNGN